MSRARFAISLALAAGLTAAAAPPALAATVQCGDVVTKSVTLGANVIGCPDTGLVVGADNVVINLNGHRLAHDASPANLTDFGIDAAGHDGVQVRNGTIADFERGVFLDGDRSTVSGLNSRSNRQGVQIEGVNNRVLSSRFTEASSAVFAFQSQNTLLNGVNANVGGGELRIHTGMNNRIVNSQANGGIFMFRQQGGEVRGNVVSTTSIISPPALNVRESDNVLVYGNRIPHAESTGLQVSESSRIRVIANRVFKAGAAGMRLQLDPVGAANVISNNLVQFSDEEGLEMLRPRGALVRYNVFGAQRGTSGAGGGNGGNGIVINGCCTAEDVTLRFNKTHGNGGDGVFVPASATNLVLEDHAANFNDGDGIQVDTASAVLSRNAAFRNLGWGILAAPGVTDGGGNRAGSNGAGNCSAALSC